jgi:subtilisin family serine protease
MDHRIDPQLAFLAEMAEKDRDRIDELAATGIFGFEARAGEKRVGRRGKAVADEVLVLVQSSGEAEDLRKAGLVIRSEIADVFTGTIALDKLPALAAVDGVERIESSRELHSELDLAVVESRADLVHQGPPGRRGSGVIIGIVDTGIDFTHPNFRRSDGTSRILFIWDQALTRAGGEVAPDGFGYGVEYTNTQISAALSAANPFATVRHRDLDGHGTHVAGIAAGDGSASGQGQSAFSFIGVAPEADLIVVRVAGGGSEGLGTSANALDAVNFCYQRAATMGRPIVVNMSLGDNLGPHDGTSLLERGLDNLLGGPRRAFVKSAGNVGNAMHHAGGSVPTGGTVDVGFLEPTGNVSPDQLDFWYGGGNTFRAAVIDAAGNGTGWVNVGTATTVTLTGGNTVRIDHRDDDPFNGDKRIFITIQRGTASQILPGSWSVRLRSVSSAAGGRFDGWIQRHNTFNQRPTFNDLFESNDRTISTPGTATKVITAANYITRGAGVGSLSASSSRGPTRDDRAAPTIAAPGQSIVSTRAEPGDGDPYVGLSGTSMSAPHVAGVIALMLQKNPNRTQEQLRDCLTSTARIDAFTGPLPNTAWGAGKLDAQAAVDCVPAKERPEPPPESVVVATCPSVTVRCAEPSRIECPPPSVVITTCHTVVVDCPSVVVRCPQPTLVDCPPASVVITTCPSATVRCPSVVDACASAVVRCSQPTVVDCLSVPVTKCPSVLRACPSVAVQCASNAITCQPTVVDCPSVPAVTCGGPSVVDACPSTPGGCTFDPGPIFRPRTERAEPELPKEGYYEYDDGWFDAD